MADFVANIQARLDTKNIPNDIKQIETKNSVQLSQFTVNQANLTRAIQNALNSTTFTIRNINIPNLAPQFQNVGQNIGSSISTGLQRSLSIGVDSIEDMTTLLQNMGVQGRNIDAVTEKLNNMNIAVTRINTQMRGTNIDMRVTGIDELGRVVTSVQRLNTAAEEGEEPITHLGTTIQQSFDTGATAARQFARDLENAQAALGNNTLNASISGLQASYVRVANTGHESLGSIQADIQTLISLQNQMSATSNESELVARYNEFNEVLARVQNNLRIANNFKQQFASATEVNTMINKMESWLTNNSKAAKTYGTQVNGYIQQLRNMNNTGVRSRSVLNSIADGFRNVDLQADAAGLKTQTFMDKLRTSFGTVSRYISASTVLYAVFRSIRNGITNVVELDTALVDLKKTTDATEGQLKSFYYASNDIAKQLGVTTKEVISAAAEWSRLGFSIKDAETMAKTSSIFSSISPGLDIEQATDGLVSAMKAFDISANDALDGIASKINAIGNSQAVSNADIVEFLTRSSSAMKEANNSLEETISLGTAA